jgi:hypothetical protein
MKIVATRSDAPAQIQSRSRLPMQALACLVLIAILAGPSVSEALRLDSLGYSSSWLQLQVGNWIILHRAVPHLGIFSRSQDLSWADPNWGVQVVLAILYRVVGMRALPVSVMILRFLFAIATFVLANARRGNFWLALGITLWAQVGLLGSSFSPIILCSAILFALELILLLGARQFGGQKLLFWIPVLILVWANVDWRFVFGLAILILFCLISAIEPHLQEQNWYFGERKIPALPRPLLGMVAGAAGLASLVSPSSYHSYGTAWQNLFGASPLENSLVMKSLTFREPQHYLLAFLAMGAILLLGRLRARDLFPVLLLACAICLGFALGTEAWVVAVASVAVIGEFYSRADGDMDEPARTSIIVFGTGVAIAAIVLILAAARIPSSREALLRAMATHFPVPACDFIRDSHLPGPIYNQIEWGGFLAWYLPEYPVAIDDRYELYGETKTARYYRVTRGMVAPSSDSALTSANTILFSTDNGLIRGIEMFANPENMFQRTFPGFRQVYRDDVAVVLTRPQ